MLKKLLFFSLSIAIIYTWTSSCRARESESEEADAFLIRSDTLLTETADAGDEYLDSFVFLGESTTYHLKSRGVLSGGTATKQVWAPKSGTLMLDATTADCRIYYPDAKEERPLCEAMADKRPKFLLLTFGLNGAVGNVNRGAEYFKSCYSRLITRLGEASPDSVIIINSCFPVSENMDTSGYSVSPATLNSYIDVTNQWSAELADELSLPFLNSAEALKDSGGFLKDEYDSGDGFHLSTAAYRELLRYIRTHAYGGEPI